MVEEPRRRSWLPLGVSVLALVMIAGFSLYVIRLMGTIEQQNRQFIALKNALARNDDLLAVLAGSNVELVALHGVGDHTQASGRLIWNVESRTALLHTSHLAIPSPKTGYQLWAMRGAHAVSVFLFTTPDATDNFFKIDRLPFDGSREITVFTVTLEPEGGSATPSSAVHLSGLVRP